MQKALFLDRDGVINIDKAYVYKIEDFEFCEGVFEALKHFQSLGYLLIIVTNQSGIGRGYYSEEDFQTLMSWMRQELLHVNIKIDAVYRCPHAPEANCECRKPKSGMFKEAIKDFGIDVSRSWMIGDKKSDIEAARGVGIENTIFLGNDLDTEAKYCVNFILDTINLIKN
ncbi:D-glycero-beta-D-manno-heptose 1,7-bisphosphate 7-phosphatase [Sulfurospirillum arsenophilum]|uniref:D-glycero-beta-D-manno-heptose 1,7-bisphosphate 7-phosphatase n=1 Tax=Sulfurospirillum arsenophilum TaxID=56698 RepID=UPI0005A675D7|nr:D-glycero-beta-D-manno-heptose 1,7-bisphosphate 7-phosphatase [Sulfurospirillum arsenophilum]